MDVKTFLDSKKKRQDTITSMFWFDEKTPTAKEAISKVKEEADKNERHKYGIAGDMREWVTWLFWQLGDLAEYGWTRATNKNEDRWINDFKKYNEYSKKMTASQSEDEYTEYYKKMVDEWVINESKYNKYLDDQKKDKNYAFNQAKEEWKNVFNNKFESALSPIMKQAQNRYQIDAISKGIKEIEDQYSMAFENAMNAYNDTRDDRILDEWLKTSKEYEDNITKVAEEWAKKIVAGKTYWDAYSETIKDAANKQAANEIVSLERRMTDKLYDYTIDRNFNDANEYASAGNLFQSLNSTLLWAKNYITWWLQHLNYATEELKQDVTWRYDVTEELANLYVFDEDASWITKTLGWAKWVGNWMLDSLPQIAPLVWELLATKKMPWGMLKKLDKAIDTTKATNTFTRAGNRRISRFLTDITMDNLVYDTSFQTLVWHPITWEEENLNLLFNSMIDWAQAMLHVPAKYFNDTLKPSDLMNTNISADAIAIAKQLDDKNLKQLTEQLVLLRGKEITEWTSANKAWLNNFFDIEELRKTDPELVAKYEKIQQEAYNYTDRIRNQKADLDDILLAFEEMKWRKAANETDTLTKIKTVSEDIIKKSQTIKELWDFIFSGAKAISQTFKNALWDWRLTEWELRLAIKSTTKVNWVDDLVLGLIKWDANLRNQWLKKIAESGQQLTRADVNQIYNWAISDILKNKWDILKEDEWIGKFKKNNRWEYIDVYWVMNKEDWNDTYMTYTFDEVRWYIDKDLTQETIWAEKFRIYDTVTDAYNEMMVKLSREESIDQSWDATDMFRNINNFWFDNFWAKSTAEQKLLKDMLSSNWFKVKLDENNNIISIELPYIKLKKLHETMEWLQSKWINTFWKDDIDAYKMLFFWDIYSSFKNYLSKLQIEWGNAKDLTDTFKTFFEKQFEEKDWNYILKALLKYDDKAINAFKEMFANNAAFKEIENEAANNLIRNILKEATDLNEDDWKLYSKIKELICNWHYTKETEKEVLPVVNSLFNQAKWMRSLWMWDEAINEITRVFWELIIDDWTISALSSLGSDYLYKTIISKLILENDLWAWLYKDWLVKLFQRMSENLTQENKDLVRSLKNLTNKVEKLTANVPNADKEVLLNKIQEAFENSTVKVSKKKIDSPAIRGSKWIYNIDDATKLSNTDIDNLSSLIATTVFSKNNLPRSTLLNKLKDAIANSLDNARTNGGRLQFSIWQWLKETDAINLTLLWDVQLAQLLRNPDNMMQALIAKWHIQQDLSWMEWLWRKVKLYNKIKIWEEYNDIILWLKWIFENWFEKDTNELVNEVINELNNREILNLWNVRNKLVELNRTLNWKDLSYRTAVVGRQLDWDIERMENLINLMNLPGNPKQASRIAWQLYQAQQLMLRWKNMILSNASTSKFEKEISRAFDDISKFSKPQFKNFNWIVNESKLVQDIWDKWTNNIYKDSPYKMKWKGLQNKKFVILDTETSWLEKWRQVIQLSYRVVEVWDDWTTKLISKKNENYKWPKNMSQWSIDNAKRQWITEWTNAFDKNSRLYKDLETLTKDENTYIIWHNINFDLEALANWGLKIDNSRAISSDLISTALIPVWVKNHKQDTIIEAFEPIENAIKQLKADEWIEWMHHNAEIDTLELQEVFWYLLNHALKNEKTTEEELLDFLVNTSRDLSKEKRSANALPFYNLESRWDYMKTYKPRNDLWVAEYTFDMPYLLTQMFGSNSNREYIDTFLEEFEKKFWGKQRAVNTLDVIDSVADKLWDERSLFIINRLKEYIDPEDVIDINKVLLWEEVKDGFIKLREVNPEMTFSEYCTNRLVASILASKWMYNEDVIRTLNNYVEPVLQDITADKLVVNWAGTLDTEAFLTFIKRLNDEWIINLWERWSWEYSNAIKKILEKVRGTNVTPEAWVTKQWLNINFYKDSLTYSLTEFNKALYDYIKTGWDGKSLWFAAKDLMHQLFWQPTRQWDDIVFEWWLFPEYMNTASFSEVVWEFTRTWRSWEEEAVEIINTNSLEWLLKSKQDELAYWENNKRWVYLSNLKQKLDTKQISKEEYDKEVKSLDIVMRERYHKMEQLKDEITDIENAIKEKGQKNIDWSTELGSDMWTILNKEDEDVYEKWLSVPVMEREEVNETEEIAKANVENRMIENQDAVDTLSRQPSSLESRIADEVEKSILDESFIDNLYWKAPLVYDNKFLIDETSDSTKDYIKTSYNGILDMLSYGKEDNKEEILNYLKQRYEDINKELPKIKKQDEWNKKNAVSSFLYNAISTLEWTRASLDPQHMSQIYWFDKNLIWANTSRWTIKRIDVNVRVWRDNIFAWRVFWPTDFNTNEFMSTYIDALEAGGNKKILINYEMETSEWTKDVTEAIKPKELFDSSFGKYLLDQYWIPRSEVPAGEYEKTIPAISLIKSKMKRVNVDDKWWTFRKRENDWKVWPWYKWNKETDWVVVPDKDIWLEGIGASNKKYWYITKWLDKEQQEQLEKILWDNDIYEYIKSNWTTEIDRLIRNAWYDSAEDLIYKSVILPAAEKWKKDMRDWRSDMKISTMMKDIVKDDNYKKAMDKKYKTPTAFYKIDNYVFKHDKSLEYEPMINKILDFEVTAKNDAWDDITYKVIWYEPQFYRVRNEWEVSAAEVLKKQQNWEYVPENPEDLWKEIVEIIYPGEFVSTADERAELLRSLDIDNQWYMSSAKYSDWSNAPLRSEYRDVFEYVHDMDEVKVLVEDNNWNRYEWILNIKRFQKNTDENWFTQTKPWTFQLSNLEQVDAAKDYNRVQFEKVRSKTADTSDRIKEETVPVGNRQQLDWSKQWDELKFKDVDEQTVKAIEENTSIVKVPEDVKEVTEQTNKNISDDWDLILDVNPMAEKEKQIWNTRILNFTNYDIIEQSEDLKQVVWLRSFFISQHWDDLRKAVDEFNNVIKDFSPEDQDKIYKAIRAKAEKLTQQATSVSRELNPWEANMIVNWLPKNVQEKLDAIGKVFVEWNWNPQYQYLTLNYKNDGFEWILKNIGHNHKWAMIEYKRCTWENLREATRNIVKQYTNWWEREIKNLVSDVLWDPLWTWTMNKMLMWLRSMWRFIKYGPILYPLSWVMMLANSAVLWVMRYWSESKWFRWLMNTDAFNILTAPKWETVKLSNWKTAVWLWFTDSLNRTNEIMFNSNSDLWGSWFDKVLDLMISPLPEGNLKKVVTTAMKWGTHSLFDIAAQWSVKSMEFAKALEKNLVWWWDINQFLKAVADWTVDDAMVRNILADTEKWYSRFFTNSATTLFSRHKFSRMYMFNALQGYVINRTDEIFSSVKDAVNWIGRRNGKFNWNDFTNYLQYNNQELKWLLMNVLLSAKIGFYMDRLANGWEFNAKEYSDYMVDTSDYLSSIPATFFYWILTAPLTWIEDYAEYAKQNNEDFDIGNWLTVAWLNTISEVMSKFFREGKVLNAMMDSVVAFGKTGNIEFAYDVLESEFSNIANWLWRFQLAEGTHKYWLDYMNQPGDMLWKILLNSDKTSQAWRIQDKLYSLQTVDWILNGENGERWKSRLLPYIPVIWQVLQNSITGQWFTFTQAKWKELQHIMDKDPVVWILNNRDQMNKEDWQYIWRDEKIFSDDAVDRMYKELTAFDYPNRARKNWTEFKIGYEWELEHIKETVFTDEILRWLWWTEEDLTKYLNDAWDRKQAWLAKIMAAAEASRPGSSKIVISYLANQEEYNLLKEVTGKPYPSSNDVTDEEMAAIQRQVLQDYYPHMFLADKTSWYKAITEYVSWNYEVFKDLYKDDDMTWYLSTLWYMDMIMYQQAKQWNVNAKYIKNGWTMLSKYFKSEPARLNAIDYVMHSIENSGMSRGREASAKMWVLAANMDFYDKIQKSGMMNALYWDDIERYNWFVWWVLKDINEQWLNLSSQNKKYSWNKYYKPYNQWSWLWENNIPMAQKFVPAAQKYLDWWTPSGTYSPYRWRTYSPTGSLDFYWNYYEALIKDYSDRLVKQRSKTYPAEYTEPLTYKREQINRWNIRAQQLVFPKHKSKEYRTNVFSNLPGAHG